ncbi:hypothetical protein [Marinicella gelatinilytica]|uniref:hypothetical protein n=1 Tax=Marinicella gelatinilytica TaxID=2996017 RepID=UPI002260BC8D|nr:hypothetical protein [Marinicella gelatinilytica]MCX7545416.1 hypothetical protein [Marinicella gelatinilytica]
MKNISFSFVVLAFLGGAFITSLDETEVNWTYFVPIMTLGFIGAFLYIKEAKKAATHGDILKNNQVILSQSLHKIVANLEALDGRKDSIPTYDMRFEIDRLFREDLMQFADARDSMKHLFGIQAFADIMSSFAAGERYINRIWSASTDGYVDEVLLYVSKANAQFKHAQEVFDSAQTKVV